MVLAVVNYLVAQMEHIVVGAQLVQERLVLVEMDARHLSAAVAAAVFTAAVAVLGALVVAAVTMLMVLQLL
jgi:hypothetical protein